MWFPHVLAYYCTVLPVPLAGCVCVYVCIAQKRTHTCKQSAADVPNHEAISVHLHARTHPTQTRKRMHAGAADVTSEEDIFKLLGLKRYYAPQDRHDNLDEAEWRDIPSAVRSPNAFYTPPSAYLPTTATTPPPSALPHTPVPPSAALHACAATAAVGAVHMSDVAAHACPPQPAVDLPTASTTLVGGKRRPRIVQLGAFAEHNSAISCDAQDAIGVVSALPSSRDGQVGRRRHAEEERWGGGGGGGTVGGGGLAGAGAGCGAGWVDRGGG